MLLWARLIQSTQWFKDTADQNFYFVTVFLMAPYTKKKKILLPDFPLYKAAQNLQHPI